MNSFRVSCLVFHSRRINASVLGIHTFLTLDSVLGFLRTSLVLDFPPINLGKTKRISPCPTASIAFCSTRANSFSTRRCASSFARAWSDMSTQSHVRPVISPRRSEQAKARFRATYSFPSSHSSNALRMVTASQIARVFFSLLGRIAPSNGFLPTIPHRTACLKAVRISFTIFSIVQGVI